MIILGIDTSSQAGSCALLKEELLLGECYFNIGHTHSETALPMLDSLLHQCKMSLDEVDLIAISQGPGSFTGLRIGLSMVKGLAFPNKKPCVPVSTLEMLAYNVLPFQGIIVPAMDARRQQVYTALFSSDGTTITRITEDMAIPIAELPTRLAKIEGGNAPLLLGDGAHLCYQELENVIPLRTLAPPHLLHQRASSLCWLARTKALEGETLSADSLTPSYLRLSQAERELQEKGHS